MLRLTRDSDNAWSTSNPLDGQPAHTSTSQPQLTAVVSLCRVACISGYRRRRLSHMRYKASGWIIVQTIAAAAVVLPLVMVAQRSAQTPPARQVTVTRIAGKPDFNGVWEANNTANWDLQTHQARPMVGQPGLLANSTVLA